MSWNVSAQGATKDAVKAEFAEKAAGSIEGGHMPQAVADLVNAAIDELPECERSTVHVETFGHFSGTEYRSTSNLMVKVENKFEAE